MQPQATFGTTTYAAAPQQFVETLAAPQVTYAAAAPQVTYAAAAPQVTYAAAASQVTYASAPQVETVTAAAVTYAQAPVYATARPQVTYAAMPAIETVAAAPVTYAQAPVYENFVQPQVTYAQAPGYESFVQPQVTYAAAPQVVEAVAAPVTYAVAPQVYETIAAPTYQTVTAPMAVEAPTMMQYPMTMGVQASRRATRKSGSSPVATSTMSEWVTIGKPQLTLEAADKMASTAIGECRNRSFKDISVFVVDGNGRTLVSKTMLDCPPLIPALAEGKAGAAIGTHSSSRTLKDKYVPDRTPQLLAMTMTGAATQQPFVAVPGGVLFRDSHTSTVIGAIGVSGASADEDEHCAIVGAQACGFTTEPAKSSCNFTPEPDKSATT